MVDDNGQYITNETPLTLLLTPNNGAACRLAPLETQRFPFETVACVDVEDAESGCPIRSIRENNWPRVVITVEDLRSSPQGEHGPLGRHLVILRNQTPYLVDVLHRDPAGRERPLGERLAPGAETRHKLTDRVCLCFRATFTGELLGVFYHPSKREQTHTITDAFARLRAGRTHPIDRPPFGALKLVGGARKTPPPESRDYVVRAEREVAFTGHFNCVDDPALRDVEVAGVHLVWDRADTCGLKSLSGARDLRSLTIYADRVRIAMPLRLHRTKVTIYARELVFEDDGCIDTTPSPFSARARSLRRTADGKHPADADGAPIYRAADGRHGERAGDIDLFVQRVHGLDEKDPQKRLIARGSDGQAPEEGGLYPYKPGKTQPKDGKQVKGLTAAQILDLMKDKLTDKAPELWRWPASIQSQFDLLRQTTVVSSTLPDVDHPAKMNLPDDALAAGLVADLSIAFIDARIGIGNVGRGSLPAATFSTTWTPVSDVTQALGVGATNPNALRPGDGEDAYPSGRPGDGGDGGRVCSHLVDLCAWTDVAPGSAAPRTEATVGGDPGPPVYWLRIAVIRRSWPESLQSPVASYERVSGTQGASAPGRAAQDGRAGQACPKDQEGTLAWLHETALGSVLGCARDAVRNGQRGAAVRLLDPYAAALDDADGAGALPPRLVAQVIELRGLRTNIAANLDYHGNPPGWVPRLHVGACYKAFRSVRQLAAKSLHFARTMEASYDTLASGRELAEAAATAIAREIDDAREALEIAYGQLPSATAALKRAQDQLELKAQELSHLKRRVESQAEDRIREQQIFSACCQIVGGALKCLPLGQPITGLVGDALDVVSEFDWTKEKPWSEASECFTTLGDTVDGFMEDNKDKLVARSIEGLEKEVQSLDDRSEGLDREIRAVQGAIKDEDEAHDELAVELKKQWSALKAAETAALEREIAESDELLKDLTGRAREDVSTFQGQLRAELAASVSEKLHTRLARARSSLAGFEEELRQRERVAREQGGDQAAIDRALALRRGDLKRRSEQLGAIDTLSARKTAIESDTEALKTRSEAREKKTATTVDSLAKVGKGIGKIGAGICKLAAPFDRESPHYKGLVGRMLDEGSQFHGVYETLKDDLDALTAAKSRAAEELIYWHGRASRATGQIAENLSELDVLGRTRRSLDGALDARVKVLLRGIQRRARDNLQMSLHHFIKAWQYEYLADVGDELHDFTLWVERLHKVAEEKLRHEQGKRSARLSVKETDEIEEGVLRDQFLQLFAELLRRRQSNAGRRKNFQTCELPEPLRRRLCETGRVSFSPVLLGVSSFKAVDARIVDVELETLEFTPVDDQHLSLRLRVEHSGESVLRGRDGDGFAYFFFRAARNDDPISWGFTWNPIAGDHTVTIARDKELAVADEMLVELASLGGEALKVQEYMPSLFSELTLSYNADNPRVRGRLRSIDAVKLKIAYCDRG